MPTEVTGFEGLVKYILFVSGNAIVVIHPGFVCQQNEGALLVFYIKVQSASLHASHRQLTSHKGFFSLHFSSLALPRTSSGEKAHIDATQASCGSAAVPYITQILLAAQFLDESCSHI